MLPSSPSLTALSTVISLPSLNFRSSLRLGLLAALPSPRPKLFAVAAIGASVGSVVAICRRLEPPKRLPVALSPLKYQSWEWKWNALPAEQCDGLKNYISEVIVQLSSNEASFRRERLYVNKLNVILVQAILSAATCLVAALQFGEFYDMQYVKMFTVFMSILPPGTNIPDAFTNSSGEEQAHICVLESTAKNRAALLIGLEYLIGISYVKDTKVFKVCLDYWNILALELFEAHSNMENPATAGVMSLQAKLQRRRQELTRTTPDQPVDDEAVYYKVAGDCPK
ncbi:hypothetical protein Syun_006038 [Stephania yunnanensis]|uniref:Uncharacterized protein n=1 Tax=Stephania yunnanensis TaxID=152371 RepID=A0AAP0PX63_9MAGN